MALMILAGVKFRTLSQTPTPGTLLKKPVWIQVISHICLTMDIDQALQLLSDTDNIWVCLYARHPHDTLLISTEGDERRK